MKEFRIEVSTEEYMTILKNIAYPVLKKDPQWHFWNEGGWGLLVRCSDEFFSPLLKRFLKNKLHPTFQDWEHDQRVVEENWDYMKKIFHLNSEFAMEHTLDEKDIWLVMDRMVHSFFNTHEMTARNRPFFEESNQISHMLIGRAVYDGMKFQELDEIRKKEKDGNSSGESDKSGLQDKGERTTLENNGGA